MSMKLLNKVKTFKKNYVILRYVHVSAIISFRVRKSNKIFFLNLCFINILVFHGISSIL